MDGFVDGFYDHIAYPDFSWGVTIILGFSVWGERFWDGPYYGINFYLTIDNPSDYSAFEFIKVFLFSSQIITFLGDLFFKLVFSLLPEIKKKGTTNANKDLEMKISNMEKYTTTLT